MLLKRLIVCLDVRDKRVTKGVRFLDNRDVGDPVKLAKKYCRAGADELVFYDITASAEHRKTDLEMVRQVAAEVFIPFCVGGGVSSVADMRQVLLAGADKVSLNSLAVQHPEVLSEGAAAFGRQCVVLGMDVRFAGNDSPFASGYEVVIEGGRRRTGMDALEWAKKAVSLGAGEICINSIDTDGVRNGYELDITRMIAENVSVPVIASGGAGKLEHICDVLTVGKADAALVASVVHDGLLSCAEIKSALAKENIPVRISTKGDRL